MQNVTSKSNIDSHIIKTAIKEIETKTFGVTKQFLKIHKLVYADNRPKIARVDTEKDNKVIVYFNVEDQKFFFAVYIEIKPKVSVRWTNTEPYHSVYFRATSDTYSLKELAVLTKLKPTRGRNKGDKRRPDSRTEIL